METTASTANPAVLTDILAHGVADDQPLDASVAFPPVLEARIAQAVADRWKVAPDDLSLHWGLVRDPKLIEDVTGFRLVGKGVNGWFAVLFECNDRPSFAARLRVGVQREVPLAGRDLSEGHTLVAGDLVFETRLTWGPTPVGAAGRPGPGWQVTRSIDSGDVIAEPSVTPAPVIVRGDRVKLTWQRGVVTVTFDGIAEGDAGEGRQVTVRLRGRRGTRKGTAIGPGRAYLAS